MKKAIFFKKLRNMYRTNSKTPVLQSLFNLEYCKMFKSTYFEENLFLKMCLTFKLH